MFPADARFGQDNIVVIGAADGDFAFIRDLDRLVRVANEKQVAHYKAFVQSGEINK